jgi:glycosyltransferase involved in cell wall biosynthesis
MGQPDLVFVSLENWDDVWRRNQFVCAEFTHRYPDRNILFVATARDVSNDLRHLRLGALTQSPTYSVEGFLNITVTHPLKLLPDSLGLGRVINEWMFRRHVRRVMKSLGMRRPVLWLNPHSAVHMVGEMGEVCVIYDVTDDWTNFDQHTALAERTKAQDAKLARRADSIIVCSKRLFEMKRGVAKRLYLIENGVNAEHYATVTEPGPVPDVAKKWAKPVFGYTGTVHPERVDVELIEAIARRMDRGSLVFIGPNHLPQLERARLQATGRVHLIDAVPYAELPTYMRAIDVCVVPHRMTAFTESLNPIKLWEYLAVGKPIVSTDVAGFRDYSHLVRIARTANEFVAAMTEAQAEGLSRVEERRAVAREHSWRRRVDAIEAVIAECATGHQSGGAKVSANGVCVA